MKTKLHQNNYLNGLWGRISVDKKYTFSFIDEYGIKRNLTPYQFRGAVLDYLLNNCKPLDAVDLFITLCLFMSKQASFRDLKEALGKLLD